MSANALSGYLQTRLERYVSDLATLSGQECGTYDKAGVDAAGRFMREKYEGLGFAVESFDGGELGDSLVARRAGSGTARLLLLGHLDTVYPRGWTETHPFTVEGDRAHGPGTADMKGGLLTGFYALAALCAAGFDRFAEIAFLLNSDEEIGSPSSKALIQREAQGRTAVLVLEPGRENGDIVSARKGLASFTLRVQGRSAHAGVEMHKGRSAVLELAHQIVALQALNGTVPGATLNVGVVQGGTRPNVVPAEASAQIDVRAFERASLDAIIAAMHECVAHTTVPETTATLEGGVTHGPMEKTAATLRLLEWCGAAAQEAGFTLCDAATGGGSDGNTTAALGVPTLDGLGPVGGLAHSPGEYIEIPSIVPRTVMLAALITHICEN